jgi:hypothetical protein
MLPPEIMACLPPDVLERAEEQAARAELSPALERLAERAASLGASTDQLSLAAGILVALSLPRNPRV